MWFLLKLLSAALVVFLGIILGNKIVDMTNLPEWLAGPLPVAMGIGLGLCFSNLKFWKTKGAV